MFTVNNKERGHSHRSSVFILNLEQFSHLTLVFQLLTLNKYFLVGTDNITNKASQKIISILPFNCAITKICVVIRLAEDGTRWAAYSFNYPQVKFFMGMLLILSIPGLSH